MYTSGRFRAAIAATMSSGAFCLASRAVVPMTLAPSGKSEQASGMAARRLGDGRNCIDGADDEPGFGRGAIFSLIASEATIVPSVRK